ncbi:protein obstructor-E [Anabrus simplex]|uniref:protein obstructor-E n=1 Tax=Anabrus simplex TaxID=316456 RepID=UPI0035A3CDF2
MMRISCIGLVLVLLSARGGGQLRGGGNFAGFTSNLAGGSNAPRSSNFVCPEKYGRFASGGQCDSYIECEDGVPTEKLCPDGLLFNARAHHYAYPCQYPVDVDCEGRSALQPAQPTEECPHQYGYFKLGDVNNCGQFINCVDGRGYTFNCPEGLAFNPDTLRCDWPDQVDSCDAEAFLGFRCPEEDGSFAREGYQFYRSVDNCQKYFICVGGRPRLYSCGEDQAFNEDIKTCDGIENVTACARQLSKQAPVRLDRPF